VLDDSWWKRYITGHPRASDIVSAVEHAVDDGVLAAGARLAPIRSFAADLGVNANTVSAAYRTLQRRGVVEASGRRGTRIRARPATAPREQIRVEPPPGAVDLSSGNPDPALLPPLDEAVAEAAWGTAPVLYGDPQEVAELVEAAASDFVADGAPQSPVTVTSGTLDALEKAFQAHLRPGDAVAVEDPGWHALLDLLPLLGLRPVGMALDDAGPLPAELERALHEGVRAVVLTSRAQNPFGSAVDAARAAQLRELLWRRPEVFTVEDDHGYAFTSQRFHTTAGSTRHWMITRSPSKAFGPDLRTAVVTGDATTVDRIRARQRITQGWTPHLLQRAAARLWTHGRAERAEVTRHYDRRRTTLLHALAESGVDAHGASGLNVWVQVPDEAAVVSRLLNRGWVAATGARFRLQAPPGIRITTAVLDPAEAQALATDLAAALHTPVRGRGT
jgi:DNA-binding transcriptional MocR family regulator